MSAPDRGSPVLTAGRHKSPREGMCLMEFASLLAGESWSDHPASVHPVLIALSRTVNDCISDRSRSELVPLASAMLSTADRNPRIPVRLVVLCVDAALRRERTSRFWREQEPELRTARRSARYLLKAGSRLPGDTAAPRPSRDWYLWPGRLVLRLLERATPLQRTYQRKASSWVSLAVHTMVRADADIDDELRQLLEGCIVECHTAPSRAARPKPQT